MRRQAREIALQILFQTEFTTQIPISQFIELYGEKFEQDAVEYAEVLINGIKSNLEKIDAVITANSKNWSLNRIAMVDRNILRIAIFEMKFSSEQIKPGIAINEAVEIAKTYGSTDSASFVNGLLDSVSKGA